MTRRLRQHLGMLVILGATAFGTSATVVSTTQAVSGGHPPIIRLRHGTSTNWSGYAAYGSPNSFNGVTATWVQPAVDCSSGSTNTYSSFWVGLDGYSSSTVEQLGTEGDCSSGVAHYYSWWEMYPHPGYYAGVTVTPNDSYTASVTAAGKGTFTLTLVDTTSGQRFSTTQKLPSAKRASAEVIAEAPWSGGVLPLANFGTVRFTGATANGTGIGYAPNLDPITMLNPAGMKATPSNFTDAPKQNFSISWSAS
jgi:hypothetical protein